MLDDTDADGEQTKVLAWRQPQSLCLEQWVTWCVRWACTCPASRTWGWHKVWRKATTDWRFKGQTVIDLKHRSKKRVNDVREQTLFRMLWANGWDTDGDDQMRCRSWWSGKHSGTVDSESKRENHVPHGTTTDVNEHIAKIHPGSPTETRSSGGWRTRCDS